MSIRFVDSTDVVEEQLLVPSIEIGPTGVDLCIRPRGSLRKWFICRLTTRGTLMLHSGVSKDLELQLDGEGRIKTEMD